MELEQYRNLNEKATFFSEYRCINEIAEFDSWERSFNKEGLVFRGVNEAKFKIYTSAQNILHSWQKVNILHLQTHKN